MSVYVFRLSKSTENRQSSDSCSGDGGAVYYSTVWHTHLHAGSGRVGQLDSSTETLVLLRVIVLQSNLYRRRSIVNTKCCSD